MIRRPSCQFWRTCLWNGFLGWTNKEVTLARQPQQELVGSNKIYFGESGGVKRVVQLLKSADEDVVLASINCLRSYGETRRYFFFRQ